MKSWLVLVVLAGCNLGGVKGSGTEKVERRSIPAVAALQIAGSFDVDLTLGGEPRLELRGDDNLLPLITSELSGDQVLALRATQSLRPSLPLRVTVVLPSMITLEASGSGDVTLHGGHQDLLNVTLSGSGSVHGQGAVRELIANVTGSGDLALGELSAEHATVQVTGSGDATVAVSRALEVTIAGSGTVRYRGNPSEVNKRISGSGELIKQ